MTETDPAPAPLDLTGLLADQLAWHWEQHLRPRLTGLTDDEYFWEPVAGCWSLRPREQSRSAVPAGSGRLVADFAFPEPQPPPFTTIAWRVGHILVGIFGARNASHFGGPPVDYETVEWPETADDALRRLDEAYERWMAAVRALDLPALAAPVGPAEGPYADRSMAELVLHIHREVIHHGAEILTLRDLYRGRPSTPG